MQLSANVVPMNASNKEVAWSVENGTGSATISADGILTAVSNGKVIVKATAKDGSGKFGALTVTISGQNAKTNNEDDDDKKNNKNNKNNKDNDNNGNGQHN